MLGGLVVALLAQVRMGTVEPSRDVREVDAAHGPRGDAAVETERLHVPNGEAEVEVVGAEQRVHVVAAHELPAGKGHGVRRRVVELHERKAGAVPVRILLLVGEHVAAPVVVTGHDEVDTPLARVEVGERVAGPRRDFGDGGHGVAGWEHVKRSLDGRNLPVGEDGAHVAGLGVHLLEAEEVALDAVAEVNRNVLARVAVVGVDVILL